MSPIYYDGGIEVWWAYKKYNKCGMHREAYKAFKEEMPMIYDRVVQQRSTVTPKWPWQSNT